MLRSNRERPPGWNNSYVVSALILPWNVGTKECWVTCQEFESVRWPSPGKTSLKARDDSKKKIGKSWKRPFNFLKVLDLFWQMAKSIVSSGTTLPRLRPSPALAHKAKAHVITLFQHTKISHPTSPSREGRGRDEGLATTKPCVIVTMTKSVEIHRVKCYELAASVVINERRKRSASNYYIEVITFVPLMISNKQKLAKTLHKYW